MKKLFVLLLLLSTIISGCSTDSQVVNSTEFCKRKDMVENWLINSPIVSNGKGEVKVIYEKVLTKTQKVKAPVAGSVYHLYQDLALKREDGFFPITTTTAEAQYLITASYLYEETKDTKLKERMDSVANRLSNKIFYSNLYENKLALIHRANMYDFDKSSWVEKIEEVYVEDILNTIYAFCRYTEVTGDKKYYPKAIELADSIIAIQKYISKEDNQNNGALFYRLVNYQKENRYYPNFGIYPFNLTEAVYNSLSSIYTLSKKDEYLNSRDKYMSWVLNNLKKEDMWYDIGIPYVGKNEKDKGLMYSEETWGNNTIIESTQVLKMMNGLAKWDINTMSLFDKTLETSIGTKKVSKWYIPQYVGANGMVTFKGDATVVPETYLLSYMKLKGNEEAVKGLAKRICEEQNTKGDNVVKGVWRESALTNITNSLIIVEKLIEVFR